MSIKKNCLWISPKEIYPVNDGAKVASRSLMKAIRPHFNGFDLLIYSEDEARVLKSHEQYMAEIKPTNIHLCSKKSFKSSLLKFLYFSSYFLTHSHLPLTTSYFNSSQKRKKIKKFLDSSIYDVIVFDGLHPFCALSEILEDDKFRNTRIVYRAHNIEEDLWSSAAGREKNRLVKKLLCWQGEKMRKLEKELLAKSSKVWTISPEDLDGFSAPLMTKKLELIPVGLDFNKALGALKSKKIKLLFLGKLDWAPNKDGLKWFLEFVWPLIDKSNYELHIAGSGNSSWLTKKFFESEIHFHGMVENIDELYAQCDFSIIPIHFGSGTRIKVIESISKCIPILSTQMGVQGSNLLSEDYYQANTAAEWVELIHGLDRLAGERNALVTFNKFKAIYSPEIIAEKAYSTLL